MWGDARICIRRIPRMWDLAVVCNPMQDLSPPTILYQWRGVCALLMRGLIDSFLPFGDRQDLKDWLNFFRVFISHLSCKNHKTHSHVIPVWNYERFLVLHHWKVTWMSTFLFPDPQTAPDLLPFDGVMRSSRFIPQPVIAACNLH